MNDAPGAIGHSTPACDVDTVLETGEVEDRSRQERRDHRLLEVSRARDGAPPDHRNVVCPGPTDTALRAEVGASARGARSVAGMQRAIPLRRLAGSPHVDRARAGAPSGALRRALVQRRPDVAGRADGPALGPVATRRDTRDVARHARGPGGSRCTRSWRRDGRRPNRSARARESRSGTTTRILRTADTAARCLTTRTVFIAARRRAAGPSCRRSSTCVHSDSGSSTRPARRSRAHLADQREVSTPTTRTATWRSSRGGHRREILHRLRRALRRPQRVERLSYSVSSASILPSVP